MILTLGVATPAHAVPVPVPSPGQGGSGVLGPLQKLFGAGQGGRPQRPQSVDLGLEAVPHNQLTPKGVAWKPQKRVTELTGRRTQNGSVYQLSDGRTQAEISQVPVHYRDAKGAWRPIDTTVRTSSRAGFTRENTTNAYTSLFGDASDRIVRFQTGGRSVEIGLDAPPAPITSKSSGSTVTFPGLAGGADLVYDVTPAALKESIVLAKKPEDGYSITFLLKTGGLLPVQHPDGSIGFTGEDATRDIFAIPAPYMVDSKDDATSPAGKAMSTKVTQTFERRGALTAVTLAADKAWLADPARVYPVTIDPTVKIQPNPTDGQDAEIYSGSANTNYGGSYQLKVGTDATDSWRTLVRFPLFGIPAGTQIDDAQLQLYYDQTHYDWSYDVAMEARRVTTSWSESTATWANMNANMAAQPAGNMVTVDDGDAGTSLTGSWPYSTNSSLTPKAINADYRFNNDATAGDTHTWVPTLTEAGDYQVEVHFTSESDRSTATPYTVYYNGGSKTYTVDQTGAADGIWKTLGVHTFAAGTTGKVVLKDVAGKSVIADAVRFTKWGAATKARAVSSVWNSFAVRNTVQDWLNGTQPNYGFMVKAVDEGVKGRGGPVYEAAEYAYLNARRDYNLPKLVVTWGRPAVAVNPPTTVSATGASLSWPAYTDPSSATGDDIVEYQVHRSVYQTFTPSAATLVAPVAAGTLSYQDTTAVPTPTDETDPLKQHYYYYLVAVKTRDGQVIAGPTQGVLLPKAGRTTKIFRETSAGQVPDTTLAKALPDTNVNVYDGDPFVSPGNNSAFYGTTRGLVKFANLSGIPSGAQVVDAQLQMWNTSLYPGTVTGGKVDVHRLTKAFDETTATWNKATATTAWSAPGGDYDSTAESYNDGFTNDPEWSSWTTTNTVKSWIASPSTNNGFLLKFRDETVATERAMLLSSEGAEPMLRPTLQVTYVEPTPASTYYAADTPHSVTPGDSVPVTVSVSNPTGAALPAATWELSYHWALPDGTDATTSGNQVASALPKDIAAGATVDVPATVKAPAAAADGTKRSDYTLQWELHNKTTGQWLSATNGIAPLAQPVAVEEPTSDQLGLEKFYAYAGKNTGSGGALMNNLFAGNTVWSYNALTNPSRGISTFVRMAYNSQDTTDTVAGFGWSLQASSLMRLGTPLDFHPNPHPTTVKLTDGDGTTHTFSWNAGANEWKSPAGVHLFLQQQVECTPQTEEAKAWVLTRPDRTQFFYDCDGYLSSVTDKNSNTMTFTYEVRRSQNKPTKFLQYITDASGRQTLTLAYWAKGDTYDYIDDSTWTKVTGQSNLTNPKIIDHVRSITDISGRKLTLTYTVKGLLGELVDGAGSAQPKVFAFRYDMTQGNKNVKLVRVTDPRGHATGLAYYDLPDDDPKFHWNTKTYTDRLGYPTSFAYTDPDGQAGNTISTVVTDGENHATTYLTDGFGRPFQTTNAKNETTKLGWDADHNVIRLEEANGAVSTWAYDPKTGYPTEVKNAEAVRNGWPGTTLAYQTGVNGHIADLIAKQSSEGRLWNFGYDAVGNLTTVTDPVGTSTPAAGDYTTTYTYDIFGRLDTSKDANGNVTKYGAYDPSGYPGTTTDPLNNTTTVAYDVRGNVVKVTDPLGKDTTQTYDTFGRPLVNTAPKSAGVTITTPAPTYDGNDNITAKVAANGAVSTAVYDDADQLSYTLAPIDKAGDPQRKTSFTYDRAGNLLTKTDPKGNLTSDPSDFTTQYRYDPIYQLTSVVDAGNHTISYEYNNVGDVVRLIDGRKNATPDPDDSSALLGYDLAHRRTSVTDALGKAATKVYDKDGLVVAQIDRAGQRTDMTLDRRGLTTEIKAPQKDLGGGNIQYGITRYEYDQVGNKTKTITPRGVATTDDPDDFATVSVYDALNRVKETKTAYDKDDARYKTPDSTFYNYDAAGRLASVSAPPSAGQTVRNDTGYTYFDNGWPKSSTDPWDIVTTYDYNELGKETIRTITSAGGSSSRTQSWQYYADGKEKGRADDGVPVGAQVVLVDNSDVQNVTATGTWTAGTTATGKYGPDYTSHAAGTTTDKLTWTLTVPQAGTYEAFVRFPQVSGAATDAEYTVTTAAGDTVKTISQAAGAGAWVSLGSYAFAEGIGASITLSGQAGGVVTADAVKLVRDHSGDVDTEAKDYSYAYDANGNLTSIADGSSNSVVDAYAVTYNTLNQVTQVQESKAGTVKHTTGFTYDENGQVLTRTHDGENSTYEYDPRGLTAKITNADSATDPSPKVTTYTYTDLGQVLKQVKANGNTVDYTYNLDGAIQHQVEKKPGGTLVAEHQYTYDLNGNRSQDVATLMNADNHGAQLHKTADYAYDPRDRVVSVTKTGDGAGSESYTYDANGNVIAQTVGGVSSTSVYDRNRLLTSTSGGVTARYNYDPFGRLDTVTAGGQISARYVYDGFDRTVEERVGGTTTRKTYDPLDRTATTTEKAGTPDEKTTTLAYLGLTDQLLSEVSGGNVDKAYQYAPWGELLSEDKRKTDGTQESSYFAYNSHTDVDAITSESGDTRATYGYTAYGQNDDALFTGVDKPDVQDPTKEVYNAYRFNAKRWDAAASTYDMGFRDYSPGLNRFLTRDCYNGALADMHLGTDPWTSNRYAFAGGNPISGVELDGHDVRHDAALLDTAAMIQMWAWAFNIDGNVTVDVGPGGHTSNAIPGGAKDGSGATGYADIIFWGEDVVYIWEVKPASYYSTGEGKDQLQRYITKLQEDLRKKGDTRTVLPGPGMPTRSGVPTPTGPIRVWSKADAPGMRYYANDDSKKNPPTEPPPVTVPVPVEVPQEQPKTVPADDGWHMPGWVAPVGGCLLILGGAALAIGTVAEDVGTGGVGILDDPASFGGAWAMIRGGWALAFG